MNGEILSGLKGALERGFKLEESVQSFINSGYNPSEVKEAAAYLSKSFSNLPKPLKETIMPKEEPIKKSFPKLKWILIIFGILVLLGVAISLLLFRDKFLEAFIDPLFP